MQILRKKTKSIKLGTLTIGGQSLISVQSMTTTRTQDVKKTSEQIKKLADYGCEIVRLAVPDMEAALALKEINEKSPLPLVADIHFDYRLAEMAIKSGIAGLRINPGNIGGSEKIKKLADLANKYQTCIRVGINSGSLEKEILEEYQRPTPYALVESAFRNVKILEEASFYNIKVSIKSSSVKDTILAAQLWAQKSDYPQHLGVTEAGDLLSGSIKSALGIGILLNEGIGDTIRVSLTAAPEEEVKAAWDILRALNLRKRGVEIISCPTCGRCEIDLYSLALEVKTRLAHIKEPLKVAVMGCMVNGPGEAKEADLGLAGGKGQGIIFKKGKIIGKYQAEKLADILEKEAQTLLKSY